MQAQVPHADPSAAGRECDPARHRATWLSPGQVTVAARSSTGAAARGARRRARARDAGDGAGAGIGLNNTRARLARLYGGQTFALQNRAGGGVTASITLPLEVEGAP